MLNGLYALFDGVLEKHDVYKVRVSTDIIKETNTINLLTTQLLIQIDVNLDCYMVGGFLNEYRFVINGHLFDFETSHYCICIL